MGKRDRGGDIPRFNQLDPLRDMVMQRAGPFANTVLPTRETAGGLLLRLLRGERLIDLLKWLLRTSAASLSGSPRGGVIAICLTFAPALGWLQSDVARCHGCTSWHAERSRRCFARVINVSSSARVSACAGQFSTQAGPASRPWHRSHLCALAFTRPAACGVTTTCITPNGQATMQDLQPMHFS